MTLSDMQRPAGWPKSGWYWHLHHDVLVEFTHDIDERLDYVVREKSDHELPTRLRLMRPVAGKLPVALDKAHAEWAKACAEWAKAHAEWDKAGAEWAKSYDEVAKAYDEVAKAHVEWDKASAEHMPDILALHAVECPGCPWDGSTIFTGGTP